MVQFEIGVPQDKQMIWPCHTCEEWQSGHTIFGSGLGSFNCKSSLLKQTLRAPTEVRAMDLSSSALQRAERWLYTRGH
jgi:hypothetical protein